MRPCTLIATVVGALSLAATAPASADSISFLRGGDVWVASPDGARQVQITHDGGYSHQSQADDGTFIASKGRRLHRLARDGRVIADFTTPVSGERQTPTSSYFGGPWEPEISPDGKTVAYEWIHREIEIRPGCVPAEDPRCQRTHFMAGVGYTHSDRLTSWDEPGLGFQTGWLDPAWNPDGSVLLSDKSVRPNLDTMVDHPGDGNQAIQGWFEHSGVWGVAHAEINRQNTAMVAVTTRAKNPGEPLTDDDQIMVYRVTGPVPALPEACFTLAGPGEVYAGPTWSPDGRQIAFTNTASHPRGVLVAEIPDQSAACAAPTAGGRVVLENAEFPDWGPADVPGTPLPNPGSPSGDGKPGPAPRPTPGGGGSGTRRPTLAARRTDLRAALARGLVVHATGLKAGALRLVAHHGRRIVARGSGRVNATGRTHVRLRFNGAAKRSLRSARRLTLVVSGGQATVRVTLTRSSRQAERRTPRGH